MTPTPADQDLREKIAQVLAMQRRIDLAEDVDAREGDDGTREGYWWSLPYRTRELMLLRADSVISLLPAQDAIWNEALETAAKRFDALANMHGCSCPEPCDDYGVFPGGCGGVYRSTFFAEARTIRSLKHPVEGGK